jgi:hypothetical protein
VGVSDGVVEVTVASVVGDGIGVTISSVRGGVAVGGGGGGFVGRGFGVNVAVGTVPCRPGLCPGAAHRSGLVAVAAISIPKKIIQSPYFLLPTVLLPPLFMVVS